MAEQEVPVVERHSQMTLGNLKEVCVDRESNFYDDVVSLKSLSMDVEEPGRLIVQRGKNAPRQSIEMYDHIYRQAPSVLYGLPGGYLQKLASGEHAEPDLAARNFNFWINQNKDREILLRFSNGKGGEEPLLRAMLPASWNPIPYANSIDVLIGKHGKDQNVVVETFNEKGFAFNLVTGKLPITGKGVGDDVEWGMRFKDSDVGFGPLGLMPYTLTLVCTNGMTTSANGAAVSISHSNKAASDVNGVLASVRQGMEMIVGYSENIVKQMSVAENIELDPEKMDSVFKRVNKAHDVTKLEDRYVRESWEIEGKDRPLPTVLRLVNSYTRAANAEELKVDSRFRLQGVGGAVLSMAETANWN